MPEEVNVWTLMTVEVGAVLAHADPVLVSTLPDVPGDVRPVPPAVTGSVPVVIALALVA